MAHGPLYVAVRKSNLMNRWQYTEPNWIGKFVDIEWNESSPAACCLRLRITETQMHITINHE